jgi:hypothetical protein
VYLRKSGEWPELQYGSGRFSYQNCSFDVKIAT